MSRAPRRDRRRVARARHRVAPEAGTFELVHFTVGKLRFAVARSAVRAIRPSPRLRSVLGGVQAARGLPLISLSSVLGLDRDTSVDRRVLEVVHWGDPLGIEVTAIEGIQRVGLDAMHPLPPLVQQALGTRAVLGLADASGLAVVLDLPLLLTERGVEVSAAR
jgi:chemotaxis signal transduction protein